MKILIVEDSENRIKRFREQLVGCSVDIVKTAKLGIALCKTIKYDIIFLDHDLGGEIYADLNNQNTGYQVAREIITSINSNTPTIIHSCNGVGALDIQSLIRHADIIPFTSLSKMNLNKAFVESYVKEFSVTLKGE